MTATPQSRPFSRRQHFDTQTSAAELVNDVKAVAASQRLKLLAIGHTWRLMDNGRDVWMPARLQVRETASGTQVEVYFPQPIGAFVRWFGLTLAVLFSIGALAFAVADRRPAAALAVVFFIGAVYAMRAIAQRRSEQQVKLAAALDQHFPLHSS